MFSEYLVPFDGSASSAHALETAIELGAAMSGIPVNITVLQAVGMADFDYSSFEVAVELAGLNPVNEQQVESLRDGYIMVHKDQLKEQIEEYFAQLPDNVNMRIVVKRGNPRDVICQYANDNDIDCIIMGRRGLSVIRAALGSVSAAVLRNTDLPVLVVK